MSLNKKYILVATNHDKKEITTFILTKNCIILKFLDLDVELDKLNVRSNYFSFLLLCDEVWIFGPTDNFQKQINFIKSCNIDIRYFTVNPIAEILITEKQYNNVTEYLDEFPGSQC